jgi:serine/threonine-protein phosphatase CPPED1
MSALRYASSQKHRTLVHPRLPQKQQQQQQWPQRPQGENKDAAEGNRRRDDDDFTFVVCADTQLGMTSQNREWQTEIIHSRQAIRFLNLLEPRPLFCCICGDLVDMTSSIYGANDDDDQEEARKKNEECDQIQARQNEDFQATWEELHPDIALVCLCGNHDVGNRPTKATIERFASTFGDDYLAFWVRARSRGAKLASLSHFFARRRH